jgi:hypothetical protein
MKKLLVDGKGVDVYFSAETNRTDILVWLHRKLVEIQNEYHSFNGRNLFKLNEPYSCSVFDYSSVISKNKGEVYSYILNNNFIIKGDEDYTEIKIVEIKPEI